MLTLESYWMGRDKKFPGDFTAAIKRNGRFTVDQINKLLGAYEDETAITLEQWASGWRPAGINDVTSNAAAHSRHITAQAGDVADSNRKFAQWCISSIDVLVNIGLWMEDPRWTPTWVHLQVIPPKSGNRVYIPSTKPPLASALTPL